MNNMPGIAPPRPIPIKDRASILFVEKGQLDVLDGAFVVVDRQGIRTHIPVGGIACLMLEPGARVSHAAVALAASGWLSACLGGRSWRSPLFGWAQPGGARADRLLHQARLALDPQARAQSGPQDVRHALRGTCSPAPLRRSIARH